MKKYHTGVILSIDFFEKILSENSIDNITQLFLIFPIAINNKNALRAFILPSERFLFICDIFYS